MAVDLSLVRLPSAVSSRYEIFSSQWQIIVGANLKIPNPSSILVRDNEAAHSDGILELVVVDSYL